MMIINEDFKSIIGHIFFPNKCLICNEITNHNKIMCDLCRNDVLIKVSLNNIRTSNVCEFYAPLFYNERARIALLDFKFNKNLAKGRKFAYIMALYLSHKDILNEVDLIIFVPKYYKDKNKYNTSYILAKEFSKITNIQMTDKVLLKIKKTQKQHDLNKEQRSFNLLDAFICPNPEMLENKTILIVDDVVTTGNTMNICAEILLKHGAKRIISLTATMTN